MMTLLRWTFSLSLLFAGASFAMAAELLPADKPIEEAVDHYVDAKLKEANVKPAPQVDDANLIRRLTLDLVGRIPTTAETQGFLASTEANKRVKLVERLLTSPGFARHQATEFDTMLMADTRASIRDYLLRAFQENRPWDRIFRELLLPDEKDPLGKKAAEFLKQRARDIDKMTTQVSSIFFGVNISCAQCHDHPRVNDWKMDHYYGMKSFFARTFNQKGTLVERDYVPVKFRKDGKDHQAKLMFLTGKVVEDPFAGKPEDKPNQQKGKPKNKNGPPVVGPPKFSARTKLVELALQPDQRDFFARSIVNRLWHRFFGRGLVTPIDQMTSVNLPSHPDLLRWLARDLVEHKYDLRRVVRGLVLSRAYSRSSRWESGESPKPELFAVAVVRALTPMQLATSLFVATTDPVSLASGGKPEMVEKRLEELENRARGYSRMFEQPHDDFQIGVSEALLFSNDERFQREFLADGGDRLVGRLKQIKEPNKVIDLAVRSVLSRAPTGEEIKLLGDYLKRREDRPLEGYQQIVWALLTSSEFRFNW
jgi:hypothetical protein